MDNNNSKDFTIKHLDEKSKTHNLLKQELDVNIQEQVLVNKRILLLKECMKEIPNTDPQFAIVKTQFEMDTIELDELILRQGQIKNKIKEIT